MYVLTHEYSYKVSTSLEYVFMGTGLGITVMAYWKLGSPALDIWQSKLFNLDQR